MKRSLAITAAVLIFTATVWLALPRSSNSARPIDHDLAGAKIPIERSAPTNKNSAESKAPAIVAPESKSANLRPAHDLSKTEVAAEIRRIEAASIEEVYQPMYEQLLFTQSMRELFSELKLDANNRQRSLFRGATTKGAERETMQITGQVAAEMAYLELQEKIVLHFGEDVAQKIKIWEYRSPALVVAKELTKSLSEFGFGLSPGQIESLIDVIAANDKGNQNRIDLQSVDFNLVKAQSAAFLSPAQLRALENANATVQERYFGPRIGTSTSLLPPRR